MSTVQRAEPELIELTAHQDPRGSLVPLEETAEVPFTIRRVFIIVGVPEGATRANHALSDVDEVLMAASGSLRVQTVTDHVRRHFMLDRPTQGLYIPGRSWRELSAFAPGTVCVVLASKRYNERDYLDDDVRDAKATVRISGPS